MARNQPGMNKHTAGGSRWGIWFAWMALSLLGLLAALWAHPRLFPWVGQGWQIEKREAIEAALDRSRELGPAIVDPYVVAAPDFDTQLEWRLDHTAGAEPATPAVARLLESNPVAGWSITLYEPGAANNQWARRAYFSMDGRLVSLRLKLKDETPGTAIDPAAARKLSDEYLRLHGFDLSQLGEPKLRTTELRNRVDTTLRYPAREQALGDVPHGTEVFFAGEQLAGFGPYVEEPAIERIRQELRSGFFLSFFRILLTFVLLTLVAIPFLKRYHAGEVGVRRGLQIGAALLITGILIMIGAARAQGEGNTIGLLTRAQNSIAVAGQMVFFFFFPIALFACLCWSVGESYCRERWGDKLAAFDALWKGKWTSQTFARSSLRGVAIGSAVGGAALLVAVGLRQAGLVKAPFDFNFGPWWPAAAWPGVALVLVSLLFAFVSELFGRLVLLPVLVRRFGKIAGGLAVGVLSALLLWVTPVFALPVWATLAIGFVTAMVSVWAFLRYDLWTTIVATLATSVVSSVPPLLLADDSFLRLQGGLALLVAGLPALISLRFLESGEVFAYRYDDVPPHVRRIAERERQRVELETARQIQSSILPDLPEQLNGIELAHVYLPASEVGGDFYDVLALEDGRLAVAVGDVAGHGVSSGLVMSMARSALAVQTSFNPDVLEVFKTLNRVVFQSARKRLLATLCYALVDPRRKEMQFASAGHLFPYRVTPEGEVSSLESVSYPLGVRNPIDIVPRAARLDPGDTLLLFSDGLIEARAEGSDEMFGFERLEESLQRNAGLAPGQLRDTLLEELEAFTRSAPREDDLTLLVLRMPAA